MLAAASVRVADSGNTARHVVTGSAVTSGILWDGMQTAKTAVRRPSSLERYRTLAREVRRVLTAPQVLYTSIHLAESTRCRMQVSSVEVDAG